MAAARVDLHREEFRNVLTSPEMEQLCLEAAQKMQAAAGEADHVVYSSIGRNRARAVVISSTVEGMLAEARNHNLTRAIDAAR